MSGRLRLPVMLAVCAAAYLANLHALQIGQHCDDAVYVSVGRSLRAGLGYVRFEDINHPVEPQYPPALPVLIAATLWASGDRLQALHLIPLAFALAGVALAEAYFRRRVPVPGQERNVELWRWLLVACFGLNHLVAGYAGMVMTEVPFLCLLLAALVWADRRERTGAASWTAVAAAILAASCLMRSAGYGLTLGLGLWLWRGRDRRVAVATVALTVLLVAPWLVAQKTWTGGWMGAGDQADMPSAGSTHWPKALRPVENLMLYAAHLTPETVLPFFGQEVIQVAARVRADWLPGAVGLLVSVAILAGGVVYARRRRDPINCVFLVMGLVLLAWPWRYTRFFLPLMPVALVYLLTGLQALTPRRNGWIAAFAVLAVVGFGARDMRMALHPPAAQYPDVMGRGRFVDEHVPADALVIADNPHMIGPYTNRALMGAEPLKGYAPADPDPVKDMLIRSEHGRVRYALVPLPGRDEPAMARLLAQKLPAELVVRDEKLGVELWRIKP
jgi:hypothetical protein